MLEPIRILPQLLKWSILSAIIGIFAGVTSAILLASLDWVTLWRETHLWIIWLLPLGGFLIGWTYHRFGREIEGGNNLIIDEIHDPRSILPIRMTPLIYLSTVATHFFGGSGGREGTAVQMSASLADQLTRPLRLEKGGRRILLMTGISAGFSAVFGTPLAGTMFGLEVLAVGRMQYDALFPCFLAALIGNEVTQALGIHHTLYSVGAVPAVHWLTVGAALIAGLTFGVTGTFFAGITHWVLKTSKRLIPYPPLRPLIGGVFVALAVWLMGTTRYIGLGIPVISECFKAAVPPWDFALKSAFTSVTLGMGFKGGEVTPLFYIGATLGNALGGFLPLSRPLLSGMGFVAVFAGAANTPITCTLMAMELFGSQVGVYAGLACIMAYLFSGRTGIYHSQRTNDQHKLIQK